MTRIFLILFFLAGTTIYSFAQPGPPPDPDVPITGIEILLAAGGALGIKRIMGLNRKSKNP